MLAFPQMLPCSISNLTSNSEWAYNFQTHWKVSLSYLMLPLGFFQLNLLFRVLANQHILFLPTFFTALFQHSFYILSCMMKYYFITAWPYFFDFLHILLKKQHVKHEKFNKNVFCWSLFPSNRKRKWTLFETVRITSISQSF